MDDGRTDVRTHVHASLCTCNTIRTRTQITVNGLHGLGGLNFTGFAYAGDLLTGGFGWNTNRVAFSLNYLGE
jgi:hypothetical protein